MPRFSEGYPQHVRAHETRLGGVVGGAAGVVVVLAP
jgi:hypothetical protein